MKILAFAASNSKESINKKLINYAKQILSDHDVEVINIDDFNVPLYRYDDEVEHGIPEAVKQFLQKISAADGLLISYAEHNYNYTAAYKNLFDWVSRENRKVYQGKPTVMLSTSIGAGGGSNVLGIAKNTAKYFDGNVIDSFSLPSFNDHFDIEGNTIVDESLLAQLKETLSAFTLYSVAN